MLLDVVDHHDLEACVSWCLIVAVRGVEGIVENDLLRPPEAKKLHSRMDHSTGVLNPDRQLDVAGRPERRIRRVTEAAQKFTNA